jgi:predicted nucleic acid-binding protein
MILVDTSIWIDHLQKPEGTLFRMLDQQQVYSHPLIVGEIAMGSFRRRDAIVGQMSLLPTATVADHLEVLSFVARHRLYGTGIGYIDAHLLASAMLTPLTALWTRDKRLRGVAERLGLSFRP